MVDAAFLILRLYLKYLFRKLVLVKEVNNNIYLISGFGT
jgi:hypothetical protein